MSGLGIFLFGVFVTALVLAAIVLVVYGIIIERRDRESREQAQPAAEPQVSVGTDERGAGRRVGLGSSA